ncbi:MAG: glycosyltransferase family 2 protein [Candidatus Dojkabacteria bacterium]|nr:glycosyltransferase family 2 protein [Candidatus Dojkabacteria bacterium]
MKKVSIIIPAYNESGQLDITIENLEKALSDAEFKKEIVIVDDGSTDDSWVRIKQLKEKYKHVVGIRFSKNYGKDNAIFAGLKAASGDAVVVYDADMQFPANMILDMYKYWTTGYKIVEGIKENNDPSKDEIYQFFANLFYVILKIFTGFDLKRNSDFKFLDRQVVDVILQHEESNVFFRGIVETLGFPKLSLPFKVQNRIVGSSKWTFKNYLNMVYNSIIPFTTLPLQLSVIFTVIFFVFLICLSAETFLRWLIGFSVEGFTTVILLIIISTIAILLNLSILGIYIAKIYNEIKRRPKYIILEKV